MLLLGLFIYFLCVKEASCSAPLLERTRKLTHHALLKTVPYNSWHRKNRSVRRSLYLLLLKEKIFNSRPTVAILFSTKSDRDPESVQLNLSGFASLTPEQGESVKREDSSSLAETAGDVCHTRFSVLKIHQELLLIIYVFIYVFI